MRGDRGAWSLPHGSRISLVPKRLQLLKRQLSAILTFACAVGVCGGIDERSVRSQLDAAVVAIHVLPSPAACEWTPVLEPSRLIVLTHRRGDRDGEHLDDLIRRFALYSGIVRRCRWRVDDTEIARLGLRRARMCP